nr:DEAD/DEAH box helicase family protein [Propioniciclava soli]
MTAAVEAKREYRTAEDGLQQALRYAQQLDAPLAYATNGVDIIEHNLRTGRERRVSEFASPVVAWDEYQQLHGLEPANSSLVRQPLNRGRRNAAGDVITPRYYQAVAINRVLAAIARGERRVLLLMATGTGKTFTAMQIVAKLRAYEAAVRPQRNYRVLYLADRDQLLSQPMRKDFTPAFGADLLNRVRGGVDTSREIYFATYQALAAGGDRDSLFEAFRPDFFDLVIIDECHRGSAEENSAWRAVLDYFTDAVQLGLTATPRSGRVNSYEYFGNPVFRYTLRQGIEDGFLAPYRVRRVMLSPDAEGWEPTPGLLDRLGREVPEGVYSTRDFERVVSLLARTQLAARHLSGILRRDPTARCIVFCVDTEHADEMRRALVDENPDLIAADPEWVVRIVGIEGEKERLLGDFTDPDRVSPVVATTSRLLSTGVDVEDLKFVVLFRPVGSMVEFKQIIGRGTRLFPDKGKTSFEIIDYVGATALFEDPAFDGYPTDIIREVVDADGAVVGAEPVAPNAETPDTGEQVNDPWVEEPVPGFEVHDPPEAVPGRPAGRKLYVDDGDFRVVGEARLVPDVGSGRLLLTEYGAWVRERIAAEGDEDTLRERWSQAPSRHALASSLEVQGIDVAGLVESAGLTDSDPLDALLQVAWNRPARTRSERVREVREQHAAELAAQTAGARAVLEGLLARYEEFGVADLETTEVFRLAPLGDLGSPIDLARVFGGGDGLRAQLERVQSWLYAA